MARLFDSNGALVGGLNAIEKYRFRPAPIEKEIGPSRPMAQALPRVWGANEVVPGLECDYRALTLAAILAVGARNEAHAKCPNPVEIPEERHYCAHCGGYYCTIHAEPAMHDCRGGRN